MAKYELHLYMIVHPVNALVSSHLEPAKFAEHYTIGSTKHYHGKVLFVELDVQYRHPYLPIEEFLAQTVPHPDGSPKKTKFIASYRVLEHIDLSAFRELFLVTANGRSLGLKPTPYAGVHKQDKVRIYQEICPLTNVVASTLEPPAFGKFITREAKSKSAPKLLYTQYEFDVEEFLAKNEKGDRLFSPLPDMNPGRLYEYLHELKTEPQKITKTLTLNSVFGSVAYSLIKHGFWFSAGEETLYYKMPTPEEMESKHHDWWKYAN